MLQNIDILKESQKSGNYPLIGLGFFTYKTQVRLTQTPKEVEQRAIR